MLDAFKKMIGGGRPSPIAAPAVQPAAPSQPGTELEDLMVSVRSERGALTVALADAEKHVSRLAELERRLTDAAAQASAATERVSAITERLSRAQARFADTAKLDAHLGELGDQLEAALAAASIPESSPVADETHDFQWPQRSLRKTREELELERDEVARIISDIRALRSHGSESQARPM